MGAVKQAYLESLEDDHWIPVERAPLRARLPARSEQPAAAPDPALRPSPTGTARPMLTRGLSPVTVALTRSLVAAATTQPRALIRRETYQTVDGGILTPGSVFKTDGGPYFAYLSARGKKAIKHLGVTNGLKFIAYCWSPDGQWLEARHRGVVIRLFLSSLPSPVSMPGLMLAPYVIHGPFWLKGMQRALDRARASRAARLAKRQRCR